MRTPSRQTSSRRTSLVVTTVTLALIALVGSLLGAGSATAAPAAVGSRYVAMGESGAAGPLLPGAIVGPTICLRSAVNYPHQLAGQLGLEDTFQDISCSGARTEDAYTRQTKGVDGAEVKIGNPPQLSAVNGKTKLVTFDFGSNNIQTTQLYIKCLNVFRLSSSCQSAFTKNGQDEYATRIAANADKIGNLIADIKKKAAPGAQIIVVSRLTKIRDGGCPALVPIKAEDATYINSVIKALNQMLKTQANKHGATYLDMYTPSKGHDICAGGQKWTEGYTPTAIDFPFHTNLTGHQQVAARLAKLVRSS